MKWNSLPALKQDTVPLFELVSPGALPIATCKYAARRLGEYLRDASDLDSVDHNALLDAQNLLSFVKNLLEGVQTRREKPSTKGDV